MNSSGSWNALLCLYGSAWLLGFFARSPLMRRLSGKGADEPREGYADRVLTGLGLGFASTGLAVLLGGSQEIRLHLHGPAVYVVPLAGLALLLAYDHGPSDWVSRFEDTLRRRFQKQP